MPRMNDPKTFLSHLFDTAVAAADPMKVTAQFLPPRPSGRLFVIGSGKASARMAEAVEKHYGPCEGFVITRYGYGRPTKGIRIVEAAHPVPDATGEAATRELLELVSDLGANDTVLCLISGGGSALLCAPVDGLSLEDKMEVNSALLASGAPIGEMNVVRKHLSNVKGGKLAAACHPAKVINLLISDVPGDDPAMIASGPTVGDTSTAQDAQRILKARNITLSAKVQHALETAPPVISPDDPSLERVETWIIAAPSQSLAAAAEVAKDAGCDVRILGDAIEGEARDLAVEQVRMTLNIQKGMTKDDAPVLMLSGGECTVTRRGDGIGGPNAEFTLAAARELDGAAGIHVLACDTDGVDGAAEVAGAYAGPDTLTNASYLGLSAPNALANNDAHSFFAELKDQIVPGPTLTNVNDFRAILVMPTP